MDRSVTVKFWQLHPALKDGVEFSESLTVALGAPPVNCVVDVEGVSYQFDAKAQTGSETIVGDIIRIQKDAYPSLVKAGERPKKLTLPNGQNLGHHTGFIYDKALKLLGFEIKPAAAGLVKLLTVVSTIAKHSVCIPLPVLTNNVIADLAGTKNGALSFKVADPANLSALTPELGTIRDDLASLKAMVDGAYVNVTIGVGPRAEGLESHKLMRVVGWLLGERDAERGKVRSIKVRQPHEEEALLDFIRAQFKNRDTLPLTGDPDSDWVARENFLRSSLAKAKTHVSNGG